MSHPPLSGLKVLDGSRILAGPYAAQILGDLGAQVIKIENPDGGDDTRAWGPPFVSDGDHRSAAYFYSANRNKKSLALDLKSETDRKHLLHLLSQADVFLENFKVGTLQKWSLDYASLKERFPRLVYCSISSFGQTGPYAHKPGYDALIQAMGGLMSITGPDEKTPTKVGVAVTDITTGLYAVVAILSALHERHSSGRGQYIDLSLFDTQVSWLANVAMNYLVSGKTPVALGNAHPNIVPYQSFESADKPFYLAVGNDAQFEKLSLALGENWHRQPEFGTNRGRVENRAALIPLLQKKFFEKTRQKWLDLLDSQGIPCGPINDLSDLSRDPQVIHKNLFGRMEDSAIPCLRNPIRFSRTPIMRYKTPPAAASNEFFDFEAFDED